MKKNDILYVQMAHRLLELYEEIYPVALEVGDPLNLLPGSFVEMKSGDAAQRIMEVAQEEHAATPPPAPKPKPRATQPAAPPKPPVVQAAAPRRQQTTVMPTKDEVLAEVRKKPGRKGTEIAQALGVPTDRENPKASQRVRDMLTELMNETPPRVSRRGKGGSSGYTWYPALPPVQRPASVVSGPVQTGQPVYPPGDAGSTARVGTQVL